MDTTVTIILACLGSGGLFAILQTILNRVFEKRDKNDESKIILKKLLDHVGTSDLNDSRIQLLILINHYPQCHQEILKEAEKYFIRLKGDSWVASIVTNWAEKENVDIEYIKRAHEATIQSQYKED